MIICLKNVYSMCTYHSVCRNLIILLSLGFYVKSIIGILELLKICHYTHLEALNSAIYEFLPFLKAENQSSTNSDPKSGTNGN